MNINPKLWNDMMEFSLMYPGFWLDTLIFVIEIGIIVVLLVKTSRIIVEIWTCDHVEIQTDKSVFERDCESICFECGRKIGLKVVGIGVALCIWCRIKEWIATR